MAARMMRKGSHDLVGQSGQVEIAAQPAFADLEALRDSLSTDAIVTSDGTGVVAGALIIAKVTVAPVFEVGDPERLLVDEFALGWARVPRRRDGGISSRPSTAASRTSRSSVARGGTGR